jgi:DNA-binding CsgD family transcriptional regulator
MSDDRDAHAKRGDLMRRELDTGLQRLLESRTREEVIGAAVSGAGAIAAADGVRAARLSVDGPVAYRVVAQRTAGADPSAAVATAPMEHPLIRHYVRTRTTDWVSIEDLLPGRRWLEHPFYREVYRPEGLRSQISCELIAEPDAVYTLSLNRSGRDFGPQERDDLRWYRRVIRATWARVVELADARAAVAVLDRLLADDRSLVLILDRSRGSVLHLSEAFTELTAEHADLLERVRGVAAGATTAAGSSGLVELGGGRLLAITATTTGELTVVRGRRQDQLGLTARERQVLTELSNGDTAAAIAYHLGLSVGTVHAHLEHAYAKLGAHDRVTALAIAREHGLLD